MERTVAVGAPKVHIAIVLLELCVSLEWLQESISSNLGEVRVEKEDCNMQSQKRVTDLLAA